MGLRDSVSVLWKRETVDDNLIGTAMQWGRTVYLAFKMAAMPLPASLPMLLGALEATRLVARLTPVP